MSRQQRITAPARNRAPNVRPGAGLRDGLIKSTIEATGDRLSNMANTGRAMVAGLLGYPGDMAQLGEVALGGLMAPQPFLRDSDIENPIPAPAVVTAMRGLLSARQGLRDRGLSTAPPTSDEVLTGMGGDPSNIYAQAGLLGAPDPGDVGRLAMRAGQDIQGLLGMTLFHGTPHRFDRFSLDAIGTGEGAQAFGHGLYFAENPGVAQAYRNTITRFQPDQVRRQLLESGISEELADVYAPYFAQKGAVNFRGQTIFEEFAETMNRPGPAPQIEAFRQRVRQELPALERASEELARAGHLYEVEIPDEVTDRMLDWDAPLSEQPESVRQALGDALNEEKWNIGGQRLADVTGDAFIGVRLNRLLEENGGNIEVALDTLRDAGNDNLRQTVDGLRESVDWSGLQRGTVESAGRGTDIYRDLSRQLGGDEAASQFLAERGIPGIRFYDGSSRGRPQHVVGLVRDSDGVLVAEHVFGTRAALDDFVANEIPEGFTAQNIRDEGTRNIVVFNPDDITQVKRDGELVFGGAARANNVRTLSDPFDVPEGTELRITDQSSRFGEPVFELDRIVIPEDVRGTGEGTRIMEEIVRRADEQGATVVLSPDSSLGGFTGTKFGGSKAGDQRLVDFYRRFGFVPNRGRNKDFRFGGPTQGLTMYRYPQ